MNHRDEVRSNRDGRMGLAICILLLGLGACSDGSGSRPPDSSPADPGPPEVPDAASIDPGPLDPGGDLPSQFEHGGVTAGLVGTSVVLRNGALVATWSPGTGRFRVESTEGLLLLDGAESRAVLAMDGGERTFSTATAGSRTWTAEAFDDALGSGVTLVATSSFGDDFRLLTRLDLRSQATFVTVRSEARWPGGAPGKDVRVLRLSPLVAESPSGGLYVGPDPATHRILDDGYDLYFDYEARVQPAAGGTSIFFGPGTAATWNAAVYDPATNRSLVAGFLSHRKGVGLLAFDVDESSALKDGDRQAFSRFDTFSEYQEGRLPDAALESELLYVDFLPSTVFDGLESFAKRYAARIGKKVRTDVPTGWNSWGGGSGSGGPGQDISEPFLLANLAAAVTDFKPWGMKHFLIDDGWQKERGDWTPDPARFPDHGTLDGMAWMAQRIRDEGLIPGLWIAPFTVDRDGAFAKAHPGWLAPLGPLGAAFVPKNEAVLDLSNPEVLQWLRETFTRITGDWGYRWIKLDFSYYALFATGLSDARVTPSEAYRNAMDVVREAIGPDTFLVTISAMGLCFDVADGSRITLDNEPWWGDPESAGDQGIKVTYRTVARRYYLNHGLWINHPDLIFFRDGYGLTANEARAWASAVALTGGIVKLGETYTALHEHPDWRDVVHALLPVYPRTGRPLDLFAREYPELWDLKVEREGRKWDVVGLFHWGRNRDIGAASWEPELSRTRVLDLADLGLDPGKVHLAFDAWSRKWTWIEGGKKPYELAPRTATVLVIREKLPMPSIVFTTRHLLGGAVEVHGEAWDPASGRLTATLDTVPGEPITVYVATADRTAGKASADGATGLKGETADGVHALSFVAGAAATKVAIPFGP